MTVACSSSRTTSPGWTMAGSQTSRHKQGTTEQMKRWLIPLIALVALVFASERAFDSGYKRFVASVADEVSPLESASRGATSHHWVSVVRDRGGRRKPWLSTG